MENDRRVERLRLIVMIVIAWLVGVVVFDVVCEAANATIGLVAAAVAVGVSMYARRRVAIRAEHTLSAHIWLSLPVILFFVVPTAVKVVTYLTDDEKKSWGTHLYSLAPIALRVGIPVILLLWVYLRLARFAPVRPVEAGAESDDS